MEYAFAKAYCERHDLELHCAPWAGDQIFQLEHSPALANLPRIAEKDLLLHPEAPPALALEIRSYFQQQDALLYTRRDLKRFFKFKPEVENLLHYNLAPGQRVCAHRRVGDYPGYGYVVPSVISYEHTAAKFHLCESLDQITWVTEEAPWIITELSNRGLPYLPDFFRLMRAEILLRGNSTFSWMAGALGSGRIFAPIIAGLEGGQERDVEFVEGNWPRFANLDFITDLHLAP